MAKVVLSRRALEDLARLVEFLEQEGPIGENGVIEPIIQALEVLRAHPLLGRRIGRHLRELVIMRGRAGYLASYRFDPVFEEVLVLRLRHQREGGYLD